MLFMFELNWNISWLFILAKFSAGVMILNTQIFRLFDRQIHNLQKTEMYAKGFVTFEWLPLLLCFMKVQVWILNTETGCYKHIHYFSQ